MFDTLKTIVIGTSLSAASDDVVRTGVAIARATGATAWLVHAYTLPAFPSELGTMDGSWIDEYVDALRERLAQQAKRTGLTSLPGFGPSQLMPAMGPSYGEIVELARQFKADLIVLGAAEGGAMRRMILGSTADGVIRHASCPVFVVRSAATFPPARVEIPVDLSPISANALFQGMDFLNRLGAGPDGTEVLFVLNPMEIAGSLHFSPEQVERFALSELHSFLKANDVSPALARVRTGYPWEEILATAADRKVDLMILGTHGRRGFERLLLGSVAIGVMHRAACNLLVVPPGTRLQREELAAVADWQPSSAEVPGSAVRS